jgi:hypothetical protein
MPGLQQAGIFLPFCCLFEILQAHFHLSFHHIHIAAIDEDWAQEGYNDDNRFWHRVRLLARSIRSRFTISDNPVVLYEYELRELWYLLIQGAKIIDASQPAQDRLASQVYISEK